MHLTVHERDKLTLPRISTNHGLRGHGSHIAKMVLNTNFSFWLLTLFLTIKKQFKDGHQSIDYTTIHKIILVYFRITFWH